MGADEKVITRTCPECGHRHSLGATTSEAAEFISVLEAERDELQAKVRDLEAQLKAYDRTITKETMAVLEALRAVDIDEFRLPTGDVVGYGYNPKAFGKVIEAAYEWRKVNP